MKTPRYLTYYHQYFSVIFLGLTLLFTPINASDLPDLGNPSSKTLSIAEEKALGKQFMQMVWRALPLVNDPVVEAYIQQLGNRLVSHSPNKGLSFHFFVVKDASINAFAGPGGYIGVNSGLILMTKNESELAAVMSHEVAHVTQRHVARGIEKSSSTRWATLAGVMGSLLLGTQSPHLAAGAMAATLTSAQQSMLSFSRSNEQEADRIGIDTLSDSGFNPTSMADFFETLDRNSYQDPSIPEFLRSHPLSQKRLSDALNHTAQLKKKQEYRNSMRFLLIKARLRTDLGKDPHQLINYFRDRIKKTEGRALTANQYGYALALSKDGKVKRAKNILKGLVRKHPKQLMYRLSLADVDLAAKQYSDALGILKTLHELHPRNTTVTQQYASTALKAGKPKLAIKLYRQVIRKQKDNPILYINLSRAYANDNQLAAAYMARSKVYLLLGNQVRAVTLLKRAKENSKNKPNQLAIINARLKALGAEQKEEMDKPIEKKITYSSNYSTHTSSSLAQPTGFYFPEKKSDRFSPNTSY